MARVPEIVVVGSHAPGLFIRVHRVPIAGETVMGWDYQEPMDGGKGSNQAIAAARLGAAVSFVGCVGRDRMGEAGARWMQDAGVDTTHLKLSDKEATVGGFVILDDEGLPAIVAAMGANGELGEADVDRALGGLAGAKVLLTQFEIYPQVALHAARVGKAGGMLTIVNPAPAPDSPLDGLDAADILTPNESEAKVLLGLPPEQEAAPETLAEALRAKTGAGAVIVTVGERGVVAATAEGPWQEPAPRVRAVDTTGAGDAFNAALAAGLVRGMGLREAAAWGCRVAAYSVTFPGTIPIYPTVEQVDAFTASLER